MFPTRFWTRTVIIAALSAAQGAMGQGQPITAQVSNRSSVGNKECAITPQSNEVLVTWQSDQDGRVHYAASLNGGYAFSPDAAVPVYTAIPGGCTTTATGDAAVAKAQRPDGTWDLYAGGIADPGYYLIARKPHGSTSLDVFAIAGPCSVGFGDKGFLAAGPYPPPGASGDAMYLGFTDGSTLRTAHSTSTLPAGSAWPQSSGTPGYASTVPPNVPTGGTGRGGYPLVIRGSQLHSGRVIPGYAQHNGFDVATAALSDFGGENGQWPTQFRFTRYVDPTTQPSAVGNILPLPNPTPPLSEAQPLPGGVWAWGWPSVANDPNHPDTLLVAFAALAELPNTTATDVDIFYSLQHERGRFLGCSAGCSSGRPGAGLQTLSSGPARRRTPRF